MPIVEALKIINLAIVTPALFAIVISTLVGEMFAYRPAQAPKQRNYKVMYVFTLIYIILIVLTLIL